LNPKPEECLERLRLVDEYSRAVTAFNSVLESLRGESRHLHPEAWKAAETARSQSQVAWDAVESHIFRHRCLDLHWSAASEKAESIVGQAAMSAPDVILVANDHRRLVDLNKAGEEMFGLSRSEMIGRNLEEFFIKAGGKTIPEAWDAFIADGVQGGICELVANGRHYRLAYRAKANFAPGLHLSVFRELTEDEK
jgi:PAS domain-containing protein